MSETNQNETPNTSIETSGGMYNEGQITQTGGQLIIGPVQGNVSYTDKRVTNEADKAYDVNGLPNPYLGLKSFSYSERALYFGHEDNLDRALTRLVEGNGLTVLFITGASGSGKSSFAQAGVCSRLVDYYTNLNYNSESKYQPLVSSMHPSSQPLLELKKGLNPLKFFPQKEDLSSPEALVQFLKSNTPAHQINILVIDQFEEIFNQENTLEQEQKIFLGFLTLIAELPLSDIRTHLIITLRKDYLGELYDYPVLRELKERPVINLGSMTATELEKAIERPLQYYQSLQPGNEHYNAEYVHKRFEPTTLKRLAIDASKEATMLPLLQVTLKKLWEDKKLILNENYNGLADNLQKWADQVLNYKLDQNNKPDETDKRSPQDIAEILEILVGLVNFNIDEIHTKYIRCRRAREAVLLEIGNDGHRETLINELVRARLLQTDTEVRDGKEVPTIELIHDTLLESWNSLTEELSKKKEIGRIEARLKQALRDYRENRFDFITDEILLAEVRKLEDHKRLEIWDDPKARELVQKSLTMVMC